MKKQLLVILILCSNLIFGQESKHDVHISGFGGPFFQVSSLNNKASFNVGGGGGMIINSQFCFGGFGEGLAIVQNQGSENFKDHEFSVGHGGLWIGYVFNINEQNGIFIHTQLGWGSALLIKNADISFINEYTVVKPAIEYERKLISFLKLGIGVAYPLYNGIANPLYKDSDFTKLNGFISLKFGWFE
ncbi:MAG: hypothetical protein JEZ09_15800 [Salinivirgaceae bacterium]|nr:hypothetical protein [Salinivirgaceae bacterium]